MNPGDRIGRYLLQERIDASGSAEVWIARDAHLDRLVALKLRQVGATGGIVDAHREFEAAAQVAARIEHPGLIGVYESGIDGDLAFLAMRLIRGRPLDAWLRANQRASVEARYQVLAPVAEALDHAHGQGLAHGDVRAANVLVDESTDPARGALAHFGRGRPSSAAGPSRPAASEADTAAFQSVLVEAFGAGPSTAATAPRARTCVEALRAAAARSGDDPRPTPATVVRTRRASTRRRRVGVAAATAVAAVAIVVGALEILQDGVSTFSSAQSDATVPASTSANANQNAGLDADGVVPARRVLILGTDFTSQKGPWSSTHRDAVFRRKAGVTAADVVKMALAVNPKTVDVTAKVVDLRGSPASCAQAVANAVDGGSFDAIVVLESTCTGTVLQILGKRERSLPPVYWLDRAPLDDSLWPIMAVAPAAHAKVPGYEDALEGLARQLGARYTGESFARVLPWGTYSDVGRFARRLDGAGAKPCFYLASPPFKRTDLSTPWAEDLRIAHSISEIAQGFDVPADEIHVAEVVQPYDAAQYLIPSNGTFSGTRADDDRVVEQIRASQTGCVVFEARDPAWGRVLVRRLAAALPDLTFIQTADPADPFAPGQLQTVAFRRAFAALMRDPRVYSLSQAPYVSKEAPLFERFLEVLNSEYRPMETNRPRWWFADDYALVLVAELIGSQRADADGRPAFGRLDETEWATREADFLDTAAPVQLDPSERIYSGYLVHVYHEGKLDDVFWGGNTETR